MVHSIPDSTSGRFNHAAGPKEKAQYYSTVGQ